jgi:peptidoglycan/LPS O-acetylase OafA/YrhL
MRPKNNKFLGMTGGAILILISITFFSRRVDRSFGTMTDGNKPAGYEIITSSLGFYLFFILGFGIIAFIAALRMEKHENLSKNILVVVGLIVLAFATFGQLGYLPKTQMAIFYIPALFLLLGGFLPDLTNYEK